MRLLFLALSLFSGVAFAENLTFNLRDVRLVDLATVLFSESGKESYSFDSSFQTESKTVSFVLRDVSRDSARKHLSKLLEGEGYAVTVSGGVYSVAKSEPHKPKREIFVYKPRYRSVSYLSSYLAPLGYSSTGRQPLASSTDQGQRQAEAQPVILGNGDAFKDSLVISGTSDELKRAADLITALDTPGGEVVLKAVIYEVGNTAEQGGALQLAASVANIKFQAGATVSGAGASFTFSGGGLDAVISALDADSRFKSVSRPYVRVSSGAEAKFSVGSDVPILAGSQLDRNGNPVQAVDYKSSGVILTAKPVVLDEVIDMALTQELSNFVQTSTGINNSPTLMKRAVQSRLSMRPGEVVAVAGLQEDQDSARESWVPFFRFPFGRAQGSKRNEVLIFLEAQKI